MSGVLAWVAGNRPRAYGIAVVLVSWLALVNVPDVISTGVLTIIGILLGTDAHNAVMPVEKAAAAAKTAASTAAVDTAERLSEATAGPVGELTGVASAIAQDAAATASDGALRLAGVTRKDRT